MNTREMFEQDVEVTDFCSKISEVLSYAMIRDFVFFISRCAADVRSKDRKLGGSVATKLSETSIFIGL